MPAPTLLQVSAVTHPGLVRERNEDCIALSGWIATSEEDRWSGTVAADGFWAVVADGMGGHEGGEIASRIAVETVARLLPGVRHEGRITPILEAANAAIYSAIADGTGKPEMGTTIVGAVFVEDEVIVFNIGDSRAYLFEDRRQVWRSVDDTAEDGYPGRGRSGRRSHYLTACLGGTRMRMPLKPHVTRLPFGPGSQLLLCSDGVTDMLTDQQVAAILRGPDANPAEVILSEAMAEGGDDNISAVSVRLALDDPDDPGDA